MTAKILCYFDRICLCWLYISRQYSYVMSNNFKFKEKNDNEQEKAYTEAF